jgi:hypothetical protein
MLVACAPPVPQRTLRAPGETFSRLTASSLGTFGLVQAPRVVAVGKGDAGWATREGPWQHELTAAPELGRVFSAYGSRVWSWDVLAPDLPGSRINDLHTTDLVWNDGRLLSLDCNQISEEHLDGGRTALLNVASCQSTFTFAARGPWVAHEENGVLTVDHLVSGRRELFPIEGGQAADFAFSSDAVWSHHLVRQPDGGSEAQVVRVRLPPADDGAFGAPEVRFSTARTIDELRTSESLAAWVEGGKVVYLDDGHLTHRQVEVSAFGLAFDGDRTLLYSVEEVGVVALGWSTSSPR